MEVAVAVRETVARGWSPVVNVIHNARLSIDPNGTIGRLTDDNNRCQIDVAFDVRVIAQDRNIHRAAFDDTSRIIVGHRSIIHRRDRDRHSRFIGDDSVGSLDGVSERVAGRFIATVRISDRAIGILDDRASDGQIGKDDRCEVETTCGCCIIGKYRNRCRTTFGNRRRIIDRNGSLIVGSDRDTDRGRCRNKSIDVLDRVREAVRSRAGVVVHIVHIAIGTHRHRAIGRLRCDDDRTSIDRGRPCRVVVGQVHRGRSPSHDRKTVGNSRRWCWSLCDRYSNARGRRGQSIDVLDRVSEAVRGGAGVVVHIIHIAIGTDRDCTIGRLRCDHDRTAIDRSRPGRVVVGQVHRGRGPFNDRKTIGNSRRRSRRGDRDRYGGDIRYEPLVVFDRISQRIGSGRASVVGVANHPCRGIDACGSRCRLSNDHYRLGVDRSGAISII